MQTRVAVISMILEAGSDVAGVNALLHEFAPYILGRMGIPYRARAINIISVAIEAPQDAINALTGKLGRLPGVSAKTMYSGNIYESVNIIARRANQISTELKAELNRKLADFSSPTDTMEETFENREQIEISRYYERLPKPVIIATEEFLDHELLFKEGKDGEMKEI